VNRRYRLFLFGFILGIGLVILIYGDKSSTMFNWTPEGRVLKRLRLTEKIISDSMQCVLDCNNFDEEHWKYLYKEGDVNFSRARTKPYALYSITIENDSIALTSLTFEAKDSLSVIVEFTGSEINCDCP